MVGKDVLDSEVVERRAQTVSAFMTLTNGRVGRAPNVSNSPEMVN